MDKLPLEPEADLGQSERSPRRLWAKLVAGAVVVATLVGGLSAAVQLRESLAGKPRPSSSAPPTDGLRRVAAASGSTLGLPEGWKTVSMEVMSATVPHLADVMRRLPAGSEVAFLLGPDEPRLAATPFGYVSASPDPLAPSVEETVADMQGRSDVLLAEVTEVGSDRAAHLLTRMWVPDIQGKEIEARIESFHFRRNGTTWVVAFLAGFVDYLQFAEQFETMARSIRFPD